MIISSWNVNGLRSTADAFLSYVKRTNYDFYCLQEVRAGLNQLTFDLTNIDGYYFYLSSSIKKGYSGTAVYTKKQPIKVCKDVLYDQFDKDGRVIKVDYDNFSIMNLYMPNGGVKKEFFDYKFKAYESLLHFVKKRNNMILCGDFNIAHTELDLSNPLKNKDSTMFTPKERSLLDNLINLGYTDSFRLKHKDGGHYSWWYNYHNARQRNLGWRIDYIFVDNRFNKSINNAFISNDIYDSDHCPVVMEIDL